METARLRLRRCRRSDVDAVLRYRSRPDVARYLDAGVWTREKAERELAEYENAPFEKPGDELVMLAELRETGDVAGEIGLVWLPDPPAAAEIGFVFHPRFGRQGLASEAVEALLDSAFGTWNFTQVFAKTDHANRSSRALCERVGMDLIATDSGGSPGHDRTVCTYGIQRPEDQGSGGTRPLAT